MDTAEKHADESQRRVALRRDLARTLQLGQD
jgi:hypothetical protein